MVFFDFLTRGWRISLQVVSSSKFQVSSSKFQVSSSKLSPISSFVLLVEFDVARMAFNDFLAQTMGVYMTVDFGGGDVLVSQHGLDDP